MREPKTVLMTADTCGGVFTYALTLAAELGRRGVSVHLATMGDAMKPEQRRSAEDVRGLVVHESTFALEWMDDPWDDVARAGTWLLGLARALRPDVVHLNGYAHAALPFAAPSVVVAHSCVLSWWEAVLGEPAPEHYATYRRAVRDGLDAATAVVAVSGAMRAALRRHYGVQRAVVVHNGGVPLTTPPAAKEPFVLSAGRVWDRAKNIAALARVAGSLRWPVKVAGWDAGSYPSVEALGWLGSRDLAEVMDRAAIFALPARYEPFGLSPLEAALRGCALVLGDIPSLREVWGDAARFVSPDDDDGLAATLGELSSDPHVCAAWGEAARSRAQRYTAERTATAMLRVYAAAMAPAHDDERRRLVPCA